MGLFELLLVSIGLSMDAFAVAVSEGLAFRIFDTKRALHISLSFGCFQGLMPVIGYSLGSVVSESLEAYDHWLICFILWGIGLKMLRDAFTVEPTAKPLSKHSISLKKLLILSFAVSVDAFAIGGTFALMQIEILSSSLIIATTTFLFSFLGLYLGFFTGNKIKRWAEGLGAMLLLGIGAKVLWEHLMK
ncbi:putative manganese efflux pump MntP [Leptospira ryugenii]|uniref:Putative manganese efflux pump MntP n=1 Tax=Leptospira ryugenii TaxID=1917863 RepID=A0A2P2DZD1_9LEPT|nr:manganese efflux pump MntP family protein [Leptospira ryugenii]GBF49980.1 putative manganese efflux pump MntP [Leptospira ryugenii]